MKKFIRLTIVGLLLLTTSAVVIGCQAGSHDDEAVFGGSKVVREDEPINGDLAIFGGNVTIQKKAVIKGDVALFGGDLILDGIIQGDVVNFGGTLQRGEESKVNGKVTVVGGEDTFASQISHLNLDKLATNNSEIDSAERDETNAFRGTFFTERIFNVLGEIINTLLHTIVFGIVGLLLTIFLPNHVQRIGQAAEKAPFASTMIGFMTIPTLFVAMFLTAITIIGIPITFLLPFLTAAAVIFGWIGLGFFLGKRLLYAVDVRSPRPAAAAAIGSGGLALFSNLTAIIFPLNWVVMPLLWAWGLGAIILTRGGTRSYPRRLSINNPVPPSTFDPLDELDPKAGPNWTTDDLFADLALDLGIEEELYNSDDDFPNLGKEK